MRKLVYIANARIPTEKANGIQIMKMCEAFSKKNIDITLLIPFRFQTNTEFKNINPFDYYQVKKHFNIRKVINIDLFPLEAIKFPGYLAYLIQDLTFGIIATCITVQVEHVFTRSKIVALLRGLLGKKVYFEAHDSARRHIVNKLIAKNSRKVISITKSIDTSWKNLRADTVYSSDGVSDEFFLNLSKNSARKKLSLPTKKTLIVYTGNLFEWKGTNALVEVAKQLKDFEFYIVGGNQFNKDFKSIKKQTSSWQNIHLVGHKPYKEMPYWVQAADILIIPTSARFKKGNEDCSPLKLFEYMASGTPIIVSNVPSNQEIISDTEATFFMADDPRDLMKKIGWVLRHSNYSKKKAQKSKLTAKIFTWDKRAQKILKCIE